MNGRLDGKVAIVTGASEGIGRAIAHAFRQEGAQLVLVARRAEPGEALARELGNDTAFVPGDVAEPTTADRAVAATLERFGRLDVLVNNAGIDLSGVPLLDTTAQQARDVFAVNALGSLWFLLAAGRVMTEQGGGSIVNVTSRLAHVGLAGSAIYGATKGALSQLTRGAAVEWARKGIRVNEVAPGITETQMIRIWVDAQDDPDAFRRLRQEAIPQGRFSTPREVALAVVYLASDESSAVTGASLAVDGGYTAA